MTDYTINSSFQNIQIGNTGGHTPRLEITSGGEFGHNGQKNCCGIVLTYKLV